MSLTEDHVREELKKVIDPELFVNIVDLGLIYTVDIKPHVEGESAPEEAAAAPAAEAPAAEEPAATSEAGAESPAGSEDKLDIFIEMTMTSPMCPAGPQLIAQSKAVVGALEQVADVEVKVVLDPPWTPDKMTEEARDQLGIF